jgi:serine/threonine protein kinase/Tfp pilus assembly protein PilF
MSLSASGRTWEEASSPAAVRLARRFEAAWRDAADGSSGPPDPDDFLPDDDHRYPGARLALLRADLTLRWEDGQRVGAEWYRQRYPDLGDETLVALIYEEFCLREEHDEAPDPAEYLARFPELAAPLRRVLDIHGLVGSASGATESLNGHDGGTALAVPFPEAGQTIAGFHLVEELGRGSFARVFLAKERQLADRLVALKVARAGSREPQTLARLQHTHIVPVHSSRTDPATGLHLLWMPYFGRLTLAQVLADPKVRTARVGAELVEALDRLGPSEGSPPGRAAGRAALERRSFAQAIAWWGARMAEALDHAHDRGVLHRDIKPSNVLVTGDGMPMLLDFNLAREPIATLDVDAPAAAPAALGGTLDYMAPEHLEALADGAAERVDGRADIYSLGVLLFEALAGTRPFATPRSAASAADLLSRTAEERRRVVPRLRATHPEIPAALEVVVRRCLAPDPGERYASAGELAADLQAVADDQSLVFAREPLPGRAARWLRRRRRPLAVATLVAAALTVAALALHQAKVDRIERRDEVRAEVRALLERADSSAQNKEYPKAIGQFESAENLARDDPDLLDLYWEARKGLHLARETGAIRGAADRLFRVAKPLRFRLIRFCGDLPSATRELEEILKPFFVLKNPNWTTRSELTLLEREQREQLVREVNELLFLWIFALDQSCDEATPDAAADIVKKALSYCDQALVFAKPRGPWEALRARLSAGPLRDPGPAEADARIAAETSALGCFQWGLLRSLEGRRASAIAWFRQAAGLEPSSYWYNYYLAWELAKYPRGAIQADEALKHYDTAVALDPNAPWVRFCRARLYHERSVWDRALNDLRRALNDYDALPRSARDADFERKVRLEFGIIHRAIGDVAAARDDYAAVIATDPSDHLGRAARLDRARLDVESGAFARARAEYDDLIAENPDDGTAWFGRALLALQGGRAADAEADLSAALDLDPAPGQIPDLRANRAIARLLLGRAQEAEADAAEARRARPSPANERLWTRTLLELGRFDELRFDAPEAVTRLPLPGPRLTDRLRAAARWLKARANTQDKAEAGRPNSALVALQALLTRAVILAALDDSDADAEASRAVAMAPLSSRVYLIRARVRRQQGRLRAAREDLEHALSLGPDDPHLWSLRGQLKTEAGDPRGGLDDLDRAIQLGAGGPARAARAAALLALGNAQRAAYDWTLALTHDPEDVRAFLGRARSFLRLGQWDHARADLEQAVAWNADWSGLGLPIVLTYARCLPARPEQFGRVLSLAQRAWSASRMPVAPPPAAPPESRVTIPGRSS